MYQEIDPLLAGGSARLESVHIAMQTEDEGYLSVRFEAEQWQQMPVEDKLLLVLGNAGKSGIDIYGNVQDVVYSMIGAVAFSEKEEVRQLMRERWKDLEILKDRQPFVLRLKESTKPKVLELLQKYAQPSDDVT